MRENQVLADHLDLHIFDALIMIKDCNIVKTYMTMQWNKPHKFNSSKFFRFICITYQLWVLYPHTPPVGGCYIYISSIDLSHIEYSIFIHFNANYNVIFIVKPAFSVDNVNIKFP